jgi:U4/U6.U5 tri-snRNP-associated protein 2
LFLALDLPPTPLFQDLNEKKIIPQVPLSAILSKFDGVTTQEMGNTLKRHHLTRLPPYLILHIKRFTKNNFVEEKNPTIVNFPLRGVDLRDCESMDISTW